MFQKKINLFKASFVDYFHPYLRYSYHLYTGNVLGLKEIFLLKFFSLKHDPASIHTDLKLLFINKPAGTLHRPVVEQHGVLLQPDELPHSVPCADTRHGVDGHSVAALREDIRIVKVVYAQEIKRVVF